MKRGYLEGDFEFFYLKDQKNMEFEFHHHDFNKIIIFISGNVTYLIEGKAYKLKPWDIILVNDKEIHKPIIDSTEIYERIVIWINSSFLQKHSDSTSNLHTCFERCENHKCNLLRYEPQSLEHIKTILFQLRKACTQMEFGSRILRNSLFMQFIVSLNREFLGIEKKRVLPDIEYDKNIDRILAYINQNLKEDLSIDHLASKFYVSKYYLMHKFKKYTGYSIHHYILQKRLLMASSLIKKGLPAMEVSLACGFGDYSNFVRAFKKKFNLSPKKYYKSLLHDQQSNSNKHF